MGKACTHGDEQGQMQGRQATATCKAHVQEHAHPLASNHTNPHHSPRITQNRTPQLCKSHNAGFVPPSSAARWHISSLHYPSALCYPTLPNPNTPRPTLPRRGHSRTTFLVHETPGDTQRVAQPAEGVTEHGGSNNSQAPTTKAC
jgi:hypothetical protein